MKLYGWGSNAFMQLGNGAGGNVLTPAQTGSGTDWAILSRGFNCFFGIKTNGHLYGWGQNTGKGRLGIGTTSNAGTPTEVSGGGTWSAVAGETHTLGIKTDGTLWSWGDNSFGQLGNGSSDSSTHSSPVQVGSSTWISVAVGASHSLAVKSDGTLWTWGRNNVGQLGQGDTTQRNSPTQVGSATNWAAVFGGSQSDHGFALDATGGLYACGDNGSGRLGDGSTTNRNTFVSSGSGTWLSIGAGKAHTLGIKTDNSLWGWGNAAFYGSVGDGGSTNRTSPVSVASGSWLSCGAGNYQSAAVKSDGTLWTWGENDVGQHGDGTQDFLDGPWPTPTQVTGSSDWSVVVGTTSSSVMGLQKISQTVSTFDQPPDTPKNEGPVTLHALASSGLTVSFTSATTGVCTIASGSYVALAATGTCTINADQAGDSDYAAAPTVTKSFEVTPAYEYTAHYSWDAPEYDGGCPVDKYRALDSDTGAKLYEGSATTFDRVINIHSCNSIRVEAHNCRGWGPLSQRTHCAVWSG